MAAFRKSEKLVEEYLKENPDGVEELQNKKANSVVDTIHKYQDEAKVHNKRKSNKPKQNEMEIV